MPLAGTGDLLGSALMAAVDSQVAGASADNPPSRAAIYKAMGNAIIAHIIANGADAIAVVTACPAGPGTGNGGIT